MFQSFWELPWWVKAPLLLIMIGYLGPKWVNDWFDAKWEAKALPGVMIRDEQYRSLDNRLTSMDNKIDVLILRTK